MLRKIFVGALLIASSWSPVMAGTPVPKQALGHLDLVRRAKQYDAAQKKFMTRILVDTHFQELSAEHKEALVNELVADKNLDRPVEELVQTAIHPRHDAVRSETRLQGTTVRGIEQLRKTEQHPEAVRINARKLLAEEPALQDLDPAERGRLADVLLRTQRPVADVIADHLKGQRADVAPAVHPTVLAAKEFIDWKWKHFDAGKREQIVTFLEKQVMADPLFQRNPRLYLASWRRNSGGPFEMLKMPQDAARGFLESLDAKGELDAFANRVADSGLEPTPGLALESRSWKR
jgi:hypothetical protein